MGSIATEPLKPGEPEDDAAPITLEIQFSDDLKARLVGTAEGSGKVMVRGLESWRTHLGAALQDWCWRNMEKALLLVLDLMEKALLLAGLGLQRAHPTAGCCRSNSEITIFCFAVSFLKCSNLHGFD